MIHDDAYCDGVQAQRPVFFVFLGKVKSLRNLAPPHKNRTGKKIEVPIHIQFLPEYRGGGIANP